MDYPDSQIDFRNPYVPKTTELELSTWQRAVEPIRHPSSAWLFVILSRRRGRERALHHKGRVELLRIVGVPPPLEVYRERGYRRIAVRTSNKKCCIGNAGCRSR